MSFNAIRENKILAKISGFTNYNVLEPLRYVRMNDDLHKFLHQAVMSHTSSESLHRTIKVGTVDAQGIFQLGWKHTRVYKQSILNLILRESGCS